MKKVLSFALLGLLLAGTPAPVQGQEPDREPRGFELRLGIGRPEVGGLFSSEELRMVMTFNLKYAAHRAHPWEERRDVMVELLQEYRPLFMGTQEGLQDQLSDLRQNLRGYAYTGVSRQGGTEDEYSAIFYDTRRARLVRGDTFWLSQTPDVPASMSWGSGHPRIATWGEFRIEGYPRNVYVFNTHLSFEEPSRTEQARVLLERMGRIVPADAEVLLTGDFNIPRYTHVWRMFLEAGLRDAWRLSEYSDGPDFTSHDWQGLEADLEDQRIDWILYRPPAAVPQVEGPLLTQVVTWNRDGIWPSDHFPVILTNLGLPQAEARNLQLSARQVTADEPFTVTARMVNSGDRGMADVQLFVDRRVVETKWIVLDPGEQQEVLFTARLFEPGAREVSIELLPQQTVEVIPVPATLSISGFVSEPYVTPGQAVAVTAEVRNSGSFPGTREFEFRIDGEPAGSTIAIVSPGETERIGFVHTFPEAGLYTVQVAERSAEVAVMREITGPWLFREGDEPSWRAGPVDAAEWQEVELPAPWEVTSDYTEDNVYGWYRKTITVPAEWRGRDLRIILGRIDDVDQSWFNGAEIGQTGTFPTDPEGFESQWDVIREYRIPSRLVRFGQENTIAVRVYDALGGGGIHRGPLGILPLEE